MERKIREVGSAMLRWRTMSGVEKGVVEDREWWGKNGQRCMTFWRRGAMSEKVRGVRNNVGVTHSGAFESRHE